MLQLMRGYLVVYLTTTRKPIGRQFKRSL